MLQVTKPPGQSMIVFILVWWHEGAAEAMSGGEDEDKGGDGRHFVPGMSECRAVSRGRVSSAIQAAELRHMAGL